MANKNDMNDRELVVGTLMMLAHQISAGKHFDWSATLSRGPIGMSLRGNEVVEFNVDITIIDPDMGVYREQYQSGEIGEGRKGIPDKT